MHLEVMDEEFAELLYGQSQIAFEIIFIFIALKSRSGFKFD